MKTVITKEKKIFVRDDGVGSIALDKKMLDMLEWKNGEQVVIVCDLMKDEIIIRRT